MLPEIWPAPAKLNLFLHILGRRPDGYHNLQTAFQLLEFGDELQFDVSAEGTISLQRNYDIVPTERDLVYKAANLLKEKTGTRQGASIVVNKRIPVGGGLGGGSSDAATTLIALNRLWNTGLSTESLASIGLQLGADVPVFIHGRSAFAEGVGEELVPITLADHWYLVIFPGLAISTAEVFNLPDLPRHTPPVRIRDLLTGASHRKAPSGAVVRSDFSIRDFLDGAGHNDCETAVFRAWPEVASAAKWLERWAVPRMSGTGSCIFGRFFGESSARAVLAQLPSAWQGFVSRGVNISPLYDKLKE